MIGETERSSGRNDIVGPIGKLKRIAARTKRGGRKTLAARIGRDDRDPSQAFSHGVEVVVSNCVVVGDAGEEMVTTLMTEVDRNHDCVEALPGTLLNTGSNFNMSRREHVGTVSTTGNACVDEQQVVEICGLGSFVKRTRSISNRKILAPAQRCVAGSDHAIASVRVAVAVDVSISGVLEDIVLQHPVCVVVCSVGDVRIDRQWLLGSVSDCGAGRHALIESDTQSRRFRAGIGSGAVNEFYHQLVGVRRCHRRQDHSLFERLGALTGTMNPTRSMRVSDSFYVVSELAEA